MADLARSDIRIVNRQRGAGTRVLLDYQLGRLGISPESVAGYQREEYRVRRTAIGLFVAAFPFAAIAGAFGAFITKVAPVR